MAASREAGERARSSFKTCSLAKDCLREKLLGLAPLEAGEAAPDEGAEGSGETGSTAVSNTAGADTGEIKALGKAGDADAGDVEAELDLA
jgi:hypothetical protein